MRMSEAGKQMLIKFEDLRTKAYRVGGKGNWTIGVGNETYLDGSPVKDGDTITREAAIELFEHSLPSREKAVNVGINSEINQNQFDSLVSLIYNIGIAAFNGSTIRRKININPNDPSIRKEFARWNKSGGEVVDGLVNRRKVEADLYFKSPSV